MGKILDYIILAVLVVGLIVLCFFQECSWDIYFLVFARLLTAVLMQQLVAVFQRASGQQQAALFFVVIYVRFHRHDIECPLALGDIG